jgi:hypothetical protein
MLESAGSPPTTRAEFRKNERRETVPDSNRNVRGMVLEAYPETNCTVEPKRVAVFASELILYRHQIHACSNPNQMRPKS